MNSIFCVMPLVPDDVWEQDARMFAIVCAFLLIILSVVSITNADEQHELYHIVKDIRYLVLFIVLLSVGLIAIVSAIAIIVTLCN